MFSKAIPVQEMLALTLHFLASGDSYANLQYLFKISKQGVTPSLNIKKEYILTKITEYYNIFSKNNVLRFFDILVCDSNIKRIFRKLHIQLFDLMIKYKHYKSTSLFQLEVLNVSCATVFLHFHFLPSQS